MHLGVFVINYCYLQYVLESFLCILQALDQLSFGGSSVRETVIAQSKILLFWNSTTCLLLEKNKPEYQWLEPPHPDQTQPEQQLETFNIDKVEKYSPCEPLPLNHQLESLRLDFWVCHSMSSPSYCLRNCLSQTEEGTLVIFYFPICLFTFRIRS